MIVSLSMVQSEGDIIEYFVRSNLRLLDHMVIVLNPSEDGTDEILYRLVREGLPVTIWPTRRNHYAQSQVLTALANRIRDQINPEYLCLLDADELYLAKDRESFAASLAQIPPGSIGLVPWVTFVPPHNEHQYVFHPKQWKDRLKQEVEQFYKAIVPSAAGFGEDIFLPNGQHIALRADGEGFPTRQVLDVHLAHFPVRSVAQIKLKTYNAILSKGLAEGGSWRVSESFQIQTVLSHLEAHDAPDTRDIARLYLARDWGTRSIPACILDSRLPNVAQTLNFFVKHKGSDLQLVQRLLGSVFLLDDRTESLISRGAERDSRPVAEPSGVFTPAFHRQNLFCDWPPFEYVEKRFRPLSVLDVGCGLGTYLSIFRDSGADVLGIDGAPWSSSHYLTSSEYVQVDLEREPLRLTQNFSVSIFVEVAEHLPENAGLGIIDELASKTSDGIVFSAAQPSQPGYAHITLRAPEFWLDRFEARGWAVDVAGSISLRTLSTLHWLRRNLFLLRPVGAADTRALQKLLEMGVHRDAHGGRTWPVHRATERIIGFPGQRWSFVMDGGREVPPLPIVAVQPGRDTPLQATPNSELILGLERQLSELREQRLAAESDLAKVYASTWWRIGSPVRGLARKVKGAYRHASKSANPIKK